MLISALVAFLHHFAAFTVVAAIVVEWVMVRGELTSTELKRIQFTDMAYGIAAGLILAVGFARVFWFEKGSQYYFSNPAFHAKLGVFALVGAVSIYPTLRFIKWRNLPMEQGVLKVDSHELKKIRWCLNVELVGVVGILLLAAVMARGVGM